MDKVWPCLGLSCFLHSTNADSFPTPQRSVGNCAKYGMVKCCLVGNVFQMNQIIRQFKYRNLGKVVPIRRDSARANRPRMYAGTFRRDSANRFEEDVNA